MVQIIQVTPVAVITVEVITEGMTEDTMVAGMMEEGFLEGAGRGRGLILAFQNDAMPLAWIENTNSI